MSQIDTSQSIFYNQSEVDSIVSAAVTQALQQYENRRLNLDNKIQQTESVMSSPEGDQNVNRRQKLTINGETQWRSFSSMQDLVDLVTDVVKASYDSKPKNEIKVKQYITEWYHTYKEPQICEGYRNNYVCMLNKHILPAIGEKKVSDITAADIQGIMSTLHSASTGKQVKSILSAMIDAAIADEIYKRPNPCKDKRIVMPTAKTDRKPLESNQLSQIIQILPKLSEEYARILVMLIMTGCRRGEALGAMWEDIDWDKKTIHLQRVVRFINNRPVVSTKMKTKAANRTISLWEEFIPYLGEKKTSGFIIHCNGEPLSERQYVNRWNAIIKHLQKEGIAERFTAHQLRHTYATVAANSGIIPPKVLQGMLGHSNFQTTMNIYAGLDEDKVRESSQKLHGEYVKISNESCRKVAEDEEPETVDL